MEEKVENAATMRSTGEKRKPEEKELDEHPKQKKRKQLHMEIFLTSSTGMANAQGCTQAVEPDMHQQTVIQLTVVTQL